METKFKNTTANPTLKTAFQAGDPRIDSPEIKVVFPSVSADLPRYQDLGEPTESPITPPEPPKEKEKEEDNHTCTVTWLDALKQNAAPFGLLGLLLLLIGYIIGKK